MPTYPTIVYYFFDSATRLYTHAIEQSIYDAIPPYCTDTRPPDVIPPQVAYYQGFGVWLVLGEAPPPPPPPPPPPTDYENLIPYFLNYGQGVEAAPIPEPGTAFDDIEWTPGSLYRGDFPCLLRVGLIQPGSRGDTEG